MTSDEALLLLGESVADCVADILRGLAPEGFERGPVTLAPKGEMALQGLPPIGVVSSSTYVDGSNGGNVIVLGRRAARKLGLAVSEGDAEAAGEGPLTMEEMESIGTGCARLIESAAATTGALLGDDLELAPPKTRPFESPSDALIGLDLAPRATTVTFTLDGETIRFVHLIPNALLIRMTHVFDDRAAARTLERFEDQAYDSVPPGQVREVKVKLRAELGRTKLSLVQATSLDSGAAIALDRLVDDPVELFVNGRRFGTGELVATSGRWAVRIVEVTGVTD